MHLGDARNALPEGLTCLLGAELNAEVKLELLLTQLERAVYEHGLVQSISILPMLVRNTIG